MINVKHLHLPHSYQLQSQRVGHWISKHEKKIHIAEIIVLSVTALSVLVQFTYPSNKTLPLANMGGVDIGGKSREEIIQQLDHLSQTGQTNISTPSKQWRESWQTIGVTIDRELSADLAIRYEWWERLLPFSGIVKILEGRNSEFLVLADVDRLNAFAAKIVAEDQLAAQNATISVKDGQVVIDKSKSGYKFNIDYIRARLKSSAIASSEKLSLVPDQIPSIRTELELEGLKTEAERIISHNLNIKVDNKSYKPNRSVIGGWLSFDEDKKTKELRVSTNKRVLTKYIDKINDEVARPAGVSVVTMVDGEVRSRTTAKAGQAVDMEKSIKNIESAIKGSNNSLTIELPLKSIPPRVTYSNSYTASNAGLMAIINSWRSSHYGNYGVVIREVGGKGRNASWQPDKSFVTASTFKLFVYFGVQKKMAAGQLSYSTILDNGWRVDSCLEEMIVRSTNPCAISLMNKIGWAWNQSVVQAAGFKSTFINNQSGGDKFSTVRDETNYLSRLNAGTLMGAEANSRLLGYMKRQIWRGGIPSGVPAGTVVADKVGFLGSWVHDVAIVYGPNSTYILGIMSNGGSDGAFADLSRRVYNFFLN